MFYIGVYCTDRKRVIGVYKDEEYRLDLYTEEGKNKPICDFGYRATKYFKTFPKIANVRNGYFVVVAKNRKILFRGNTLTITDFKEDNADLILGKLMVFLYLVYTSGSLFGNQLEEPEVSEIPEVTSTKSSSSKEKCSSVIATSLIREVVIKALMFGCIGVALGAIISLLK